MAFLKRVSKHPIAHKYAYSTAIVICGFLATIIFGTVKVFCIDLSELRVADLFVAEKAVTERSNQAIEADKHLETATAAYFAGKPFDSRREYHSALALYRQMSNRLGEADVLRGLGHLERKLGNNDKARDAYSDALAFYKQINDRRGEAMVLHGPGHLERTLGNNDKAREAYFKAAQLYGQVGMPTYHDVTIDAANSLK